jgi:hypothetical protein
MDRLFIMWNCPECAEIKSLLNQEAIFSDEFRGLEGRQLSVYHTFSNTACRDLLDKYGLQGHFTPVILTAEGFIVDDVAMILAHLGRTGMLKV